MGFVVTIVPCINGIFWYQILTSLYHIYVGCECSDIVGFVVTVVACINGVFGIGYYLPFIIFMQLVNGMLWCTWIHHEGLSVVAYLMTSRVFGESWFVC